MGHIFYREKGEIYGKHHPSFLMTKFPSQLAPSDLQSTIASTSDGRTSILPIGNGPALGTSEEIQPRTTPSTGSVQPKGLQLGGRKTNAQTVAAQLAGQVAADEGGNNTWSNNDLIDMNADEGDWSRSSRLLGCVIYSLLCIF